MKKRIRVLALLIGLIMAMSVVATSCGENGVGIGGIIGGEIVDQVDTSKTQIYVGNYDGGLGDQWLQAIAAAFEEKYADYELNGKVGVEIVIDNDKTNTSGETLINYIASSQNEVFFTEKVPLQNYINQGLLLDITDAVTGDLGTVNEADAGTTIADKVYASSKDYVQRDGKYYALPFYEGYWGFIYNVDVFEDKNLYFREGYEDETILEDKFIINSSDTKSKGRDGIAGTLDDGLPITYEDFFDLCDMMVVAGVTPMIYTGKYGYYVSRAMVNLWATNEGAEQMALNFNINGNGSATTLGKIVNGEFVKDSTPTTITIDNGHELQRQEGKYRALQFIKELASKPSYISVNSSSTTSHTSAQERFLYSGVEASMETIGMLVDGTWFENEATGIYNDMASVYGESVASKDARRFAIMPMPSYSADVTTNTYVAQNDSFCFGNANCAAEKQDIVKKFIMFCHTNESLKTFQKVVGVPRPFEYSFTDEEFAELTYFSQSTYYNHKHADFVAPYSTESSYLNNSDRFALDQWSFRSMIGTSTKANPLDVFRQEKSITAEAYFTGLQHVQATEWSGIKK